MHSPMKIIALIGLLCVSSGSAALAETVDVNVMVWEVNDDADYQSRATVALTPPSGASNPDWKSETDQAGTAHLEVPPGNYLLNVSKRGCVGSLQRFQVSPNGNSTSVPIACVRSEQTVQVLDANNEPRDDIKVSLEYKKIPHYPLRPINPPRLLTSVTSGGKATFQGVYAGIYKLRTSATGCRETSLEQQLPTTSPLTINVNCLSTPGAHP